MTPGKEVGKCKSNEKRLKNIIESLKKFPLDASEEKLKKEVFEKLLEKSYTNLEAEAVAYGAVLHKRKMDSFGVQVINKK